MLSSLRSDCLPEDLTVCRLEGNSRNLVAENTQVSGKITFTRYRPKILEPLDDVYTLEMFHFITGIGSSNGPT